MKTEQTQLLPNQEEMRKLTAFPNIDDFYYLLYDRLHMILESFFLDHTFCMFINALPRDHRPNEVIEVSRQGDLPLCYAGLDRFCELLRFDNNVIIDEKELEDTLTELKSIRFQTGEGQETNTIYNKFRIGNTPFGELFHSGSLKSYFNTSDAVDNKITKLEKQFLDQFIDTNIYKFISLPLIQFGEFDGVVHILYHNEDEYNLFKIKDNKSFIFERVFERIITAFTREYEGLMLDWEVEGTYYDFKNQAFSKVINRELDEKLYDSLGKNEILRHLRFAKHYQKYKPYFEKRFGSMDNIPDVIKREYKNTAVMSIIIDSYGHNVGAHSLPNTEWILRQAQPESLVEKNKGNINDALVRGMHVYTKYLQDKSAFWTGISRKQSFGGKITNLYDLLWKGFFSNVLFIGSIVQSEGIAKIQVRISFLKIIGNEKGIKLKKQVELTSDLIKYNFKELYESVGKLDRLRGDMVYPNTNIMVNTNEELVKKMKDISLFLPGAVVGEHAFYTMLENELRNVKHYSQEALKTMREEGLILHLSVEEDEVEGANFYRIGVWLDHPVYLSKEKILNRLEHIQDDLINPKAQYRARLGGTSQDKICAAFLFNNSFESVEQKGIRRAERFAPWVKLGTSIMRDGWPLLSEEFTISARRAFDDAFKESREYFDKNFTNHEGVYKKYFRVWKGANIYHLKNEAQLFSSVDNLSRFRFFKIDDKSIELRTRLLQEGAIRIIDKKVSKLEEAYGIWLKNWLGKSYTLSIILDGNVWGKLTLNQGLVQFSRQKSQSDEIVTQEIKLYHNEITDKKPHEVQFRNHGVFKQKFCNGSKLLDLETMNPVLAAELLETLGTKILIFENRIAQRLNGKKPGTLSEKEIFHDQLGLEVYPEDVQTWNTVGKSRFDKFHIMMVHLSFIHSFLDKNQRSIYSENDLSPFIKKEILKGKKAKQNFLLVIATGRGRIDWLENLDDEHKAFVVFRPIESILSAVEDAIGIEDDIELKYNLVKSLMGS